MPTVTELSDPYANFMRNPLRASPGVCAVCTTIIEPQYVRCWQCEFQPRYADAVLPISYSIHGYQLHHSLAGYKRSPPSRKLEMDLAAVLWRFLSIHEPCLVEGMPTGTLSVATTVPSGNPARDAAHPLRRIVGTTVKATVPRYEHLLRRTTKAVPDRIVDPEKYVATRELSDEGVLLIDDTWTSGASAQSAAAALRAAGAGAVGVVVIGRHIHRDERTRDTLDELPGRFDWDDCVLHPA